MPANFIEYMTTELASAGLSDEQVTAALTKMSANEKLGPKLNALVKTATEDYNAQVGRVRSYQDWYTKAEAEYNRMASEYTKAMTELQSIQSGGAPPQFDASKYITKDDLLADRRDQAVRYSAVIKDSNTITARHAIRFKEEPDFAAIDRIATEQGIPITMAYEKWVEPRVKEAEKQQNEQWKKDQRDEIERDIRSRYKLPVDQAAPEQSPLYRSKGQEAPKDMDAELLDAWHNAPQKA